MAKIPIAHVGEFVAQALAQHGLALVDNTIGQAGHGVSKGAARDYCARYRRRLIDFASDGGGEKALERAADAEAELDALEAAVAAFAETFNVVHERVVGQRRATVRGDMRRHGDARTGAGVVAGARASAGPQVNRKDVI